MLNLSQLLLTIPVMFSALAFGLLLKGLDRILVARLQGRVGPPLLQPFFDIIKLMQKDSMVPHGAPRALYLNLPLIGVSSMFLAICMIPVSGVYAPGSHFGDLLVLLYLLAVPAIVLMLAGSLSGSTFGAIGFSREMSIMLAYEGPLLLVLISVALKTGSANDSFVSFSLANIIQTQQTHGANLLDPWMWPAFLAYLCFIPANLGIPPFDIPEAESEILEGPLCEYSGPALALFKIMSALKTVVVLALGVALFLPGSVGGFMGMLLFILKCTVSFLFIKSVLRASVGRMRIDQAFLFYFKWPELMGILGLVSVVWKG